MYVLCTVHLEDFQLVPLLVSISFHSLTSNNIGDKGAKSLSGELGTMSKLRHLL